ncbi:MAG TPA: DUF2784 domain-containing protein [Vicinamibacterales bacterium]|nr:DUF2784 domain-containing protein [Vicinamibacterales bacterium]
MTAEMHGLLADAVVVLHLAFVGFVVLGGLLVLRWPCLAWAHLPAAAWGALVELAGWTCPLTPLEQELRALAGERVHGGDFVARYLLPVLYPEGLTRRVQIALGAAVVAVNAVLYAVIAAGRRRPVATSGAPGSDD